MQLFAVLFLVLVVGCFLCMLVGFCMAIYVYLRLSQSNASGYDYLSVFVAMGVLELVVLGQNVFSSLCLWLIEHQVIRRVASAGTAIGVLVFFVVLMMSFMR